MILNQLTPAETMMIRNPEGVSVKDLLKFTMMDLLLKQAIGIEEIKCQPTENDPRVVLKYVSTGKNFDFYHALPHEQVFLSPFYGDREMKYHFKHFARIGHENAGSRQSYCREIRCTPMLANAFEKDFWQRLIWGIDHSLAGLELKRRVDDEFAMLESGIPKMMADDRQDTLEGLKQIGGNLFLIRGIEFALMKEIEEALVKALRSKNTAEGGCSTGCFTYFGEAHHPLSSDSEQYNDSSSSGSGCGGFNDLGGDSGGDSGGDGGGSGCGSSGCGGGCGGGD